MEFERAELQSIRERAHRAAIYCPNPDWRWAYKALAAAADHLDAMMARCTVQNG